MTPVAKQQPVDLGKAEESETKFRHAVCQARQADGQATCAPTCPAAPALASITTPLLTMGSRKKRTNGRMTTWEARQQTIDDSDRARRMRSSQRMC